MNGQGLLLAWMFDQPALVIGGLVAGVLLVSAALAFAMRMKKLEKSIAASMNRQPSREHNKREEPGPSIRDLQKSIDSLRSLIGEIPEKVERRLRAGQASQMQKAPAAMAPPSSPSPAPASRAAVSAPSYSDYDDEPRAPEDPVAQLLTIANRMLQQNQLDLDDFRARAGSMHVSPWPHGNESRPDAFIVEHRGSYYAVPNVVKPLRLPGDWFNRSEFGVNDEIQRVVMLPRLQRRGADFVVEEPGVFVK